MPPILLEGCRIHNRYQVVKVLARERDRNTYVVQDLHLRERAWTMVQFSSSSIHLQGASELLTARFAHLNQRFTSLDHPQFPKILDFFVSGDSMYQIREYAPGSSLFRMLRERQGTFKESEILKIGIQLSDLLDYLHRQDLAYDVSSDLSLNNLIISPQGVLQFVNAGFSFIFAQQTLNGPKDYASPEQFTGEGSLSEKSLIFNIAALCYHLASGHNPGTSLFNLTPLSQIAQHYHPATLKLIDKSLSTQPNKRPSSLRRMNTELKSCLEKRRKRSRKRGRSGTQSLDQGGPDRVGEAPRLHFFSKLLIASLSLSLLVLTGVFVYLVATGRIL